MNKEFDNIIYTRLQDTPHSWLQRFNTGIINGFVNNNLNVKVVPEREGDESDGEQENFTHKLMVQEAFLGTNFEDGEVILVGCPFRCALNELFWISEVVKQKKPIFTCYTLTGTFIEEEWVSEYTPWINNLERIWYEKSDLIFVPTAYFKQEMIKDGYDKNKIYVVGAPLEIHEVAGNEQWKDQNLIIFNHRINNDKRPHYFLRLVQELTSIFPQLTFRISTSQYETAFWETTDNRMRHLLTESLNDFPNLSIAYNKSYAEYLDLLNRAYLAPCFNTHETFGFAVAESLAAGCIPIVPSRLTYPEIVDGDSDLLYGSTGDLEKDYQLAKERIIYWLEHKELGRHKSSEIRQHILKYNPTLVVRNMLEIINTYIADSR